MQPFEYNDLEALTKLIEEGNIGVVVMEVMRNHSPKDNFLEQVRKSVFKKRDCSYF